MRFALSSLLVPEPSTAPQEGWTSPTSDFDGSLPATLDLNNGIKARLVFPIGLARDLKNRSATDLASDSADQFGIYPSVPEARHLDPLQSRPKLIVRDATQTLGTTPPVAGHRFDVGWSENLGSKIQIEFLGWKMVVGNLREKGRHGSELLFAYRRADRASATFDAPPVHPYVADRDAQKVLIESTMIRNSGEQRQVRGRRRKRAK